VNAHALETLLVVAVIAALAPLVVATMPRLHIPQVVILIFSGILIGPHVLGLAEAGSVQLLANVGLGFLFLLAGYELDLGLLRMARAASRSWAGSSARPSPRPSLPCSPALGSYATSCRSRWR